MRKFYVEGENGTKLPVLETTGDNPREIERKLQEWRDLKMKEIEHRYNVQFSREGQTEVNRDGKKFDLRSPKINELLALEEGLRRSQPSTNTYNLSLFSCSLPFSLLPHVMWMPITPATNSGESCSSPRCPTANSRK